MLFPVCYIIVSVRTFLYYVCLICVYVKCCCLVLEQMSRGFSYPHFRSDSICNRIYCSKLFITYFQYFHDIQKVSGTAMWVHGNEQAWITEIIWKIVSADRAEGKRVGRRRDRWRKQYIWSGNLDR